jgi:hypothetical protein
VLDAAGVSHPGHAFPIGDQVHHLGVRRDLDPSPVGGAPQRGDQRPGIRGRLVRGVNRRGHTRRKPWLQAPRIASAQPLRLEGEVAHELESVAKLGGLVAIERDMHRAEIEESDLTPGRIGELGCECRPLPVGAQRELEQLLLAPGRLADRREHAGGDSRGARPRLAPIEDAHRQPALGRAPRAGQADRARADDERVEPG